jgi:hypothetical protein
LALVAFLYEAHHHPSYDECTFNHWWRKDTQLVPHMNGFQQEKPIILLPLRFLADGIMPMSRNVGLSTVNCSGKVKNFQIVAKL